MHVSDMELDFDVKLPKTPSNQGRIANAFNTPFKRGLTFNTSKLSGQISSLSLSPPDDSTKK
jgi:hypothetical protein